MSPVTEEQLNDVVKNLSNNIIGSNNAIVQNFEGTANNLQNNQNRLQQQINEINEPLRLPALANVQTMVSQAIMEFDW